MCIRDRFYLVGVGALGQADGVFAEAIEYHARHRNADHLGHVHGCLLYTSDAADERSSVDLGGRRIIKKKKKNKDEV